METITYTFEDLVAKDVRAECTDDELSILESDIRSWLNILNSLKRDVEIQLGAQKARMTQRQAECQASGNKVEWLTYKATEQKWRISAVRFMASVEERILYVKKLRAESNGNNLIVDKIAAAV